MEKWKFEYTVESTACGEITIEATDEYDALDKFDAMKDDLIANKMEELSMENNIRVTEPYWERVE